MGLEVAQQLKMCADLAESRSSVLSSQAELLTPLSNSSSRVYEPPLLVSMGTHTYVCIQGRICVNTHRDTHRHISVNTHI